MNGWVARVQGGRAGRFRPAAGEEVRSACGFQPLGGSGSSSHLILPQLEAGSSHALKWKSEAIVKSSILTTLVTAAFVLCGLVAVRGRRTSADTVLVNGKILTVDGQFSTFAKRSRCATDRFAAVGTHGRRSQARGSANSRHRSAGTNGHSGPDRLAPSRDSRGAQLQHRGELDWRAVAGGCARAHPRGRRAR